MIGPKSQRSQSLVALASYFVLSLVVACGSSEGDTATTERGPLAPPEGEFRNVVLICLDCLRPDHLGAYGYDRRDASPWIDELAEDAVVYESAYAASSWTKSSVPSYLTGLQPTQHGVFVGVLFGADRQLSDRLAEPAVSVAEVFQDAGFDTACVASNAQIGDDFGFAQGFDTFVNRMQHGGQITERAAAWLESRDDFAPYFLYLHLVDTHWPYKVPADYLKRYAAVESLQRVELEKGAAWVNAVNRGEVEVDQELIDAWVAMYDGGLRYSDDVLRELAAVIEAESGGRETVICVISDHGEEFFEYGTHGHGSNLREAVVRVPWILNIPGVEPTRVSEHVSLVDLPGTLLEVAGLEDESLPEPERPSTHGAVFTEVSQERLYMQAWIRGEYKLQRNYFIPDEMVERRGPRAGRLRANDIRSVLELGAEGARAAGWTVVDTLYAVDGREDAPLANRVVRETLAAELEAYSKELLNALQEADEATIGDARMRELNTLGYTGESER